MDSALALTGLLLLLALLLGGWLLVQYRRGSRIYSSAVPTPTTSFAQGEYKRIPLAGFPSGTRKDAEALLEGSVKLATTDLESIHREVDSSIAAVRNEQDDALTILRQRYDQIKELRRGCDEMLYKIESLAADVAADAAEQALGMSGSGSAQTALGARVPGRIPTASAQQAHLLAAQGRSVRDIAIALNISEDEVDLLLAHAQSTK